MRVEKDGVHFFDRPYSVDKYSTRLGDLNLMTDTRQVTYTSRWHKTLRLLGTTYSS